jgi:hypothetical protein
MIVLSTGRTREGVCELESAAVSVDALWLASATVSVDAGLG